MRIALLLPPALALAACNTGPKADVGNATTTSSATTGNAAATADAGLTGSAPLAPGSFISPGHWDGKVTFSDISMPGMPPQALDQVKKALGNDQTIASCVTPEEVKNPTRMMAGKDDSCKIERNTIANGTIDTLVTCASAGNTQTMAMTGTYTPDTYHVVTRMTGTGQQTMSLVATLDAKRTGACTGKETGAGLAPKTE